MSPLPPIQWNRNRLPSRLPLTETPVNWSMLPVIFLQLAGRQQSHCGAHMKGEVHNRTTMREMPPQHNT
ncbi:hypothetical protein CEXT_808631 [Caerostris extrusa]|uniref:Uncharacterized protein n=1 Tax=Caerostris extrusa TaxID=172846 RepID=A0AAV4SSJ7_CAEEX|nr:hypothetical protein CEXT_808631 [Caerostris extrusa]